jgi:hypothetical protein
MNMFLEKRERSLREKEEEREKQKKNENTLTGLVIYERRSSPVIFSCSPIMAFYLNYEQYFI